MGRLIRVVCKGVKKKGKVSHIWSLGENLSNVAVMKCTFYLFCGTFKYKTKMSDSRGVKSRETPKKDIPREDGLEASPLLK